MNPEGFFLVGMGFGLLLGGLSAYGAIFAWAIKRGREDDDAK
jgi:hypothetical protein